MRARPTGFGQPARRRTIALAVMIPAILGVRRSTASGADWPGWRGPEQNGVSRETGFPDTWSKDAADGGNVVWKLPHGGRSTPIVLNGRVYVVHRAGSGTTERERILCLDAETGHVHWEHRFNLFLTDAPSNRVGWASPSGDAETGNVYVHGVQGTFLCIDRDGKVVWQRSLHEELGAISDSSGRTSDPIVDENLVIVSFVNASWGAQGAEKHRHVAFDKRTGQIVWWSEPEGSSRGLTSSTPVIAVVGGTRLLVDGNADGEVCAIKARTGERVWSFKLSDRGLNASVVAWKDRVFACHGASSPDSAEPGRIVCIDATGQGDVTRTHEKWRVDGIRAGLSSPLLVDGKLYVMDRTGKLASIDAETGNLLWRQSVGRGGMGSPVWVDGKIYTALGSSRFVVLKPVGSGVKLLSESTWTTEDGGVVELNGSPAVSNGRIYFTTCDELYCIGFKTWSGSQGTIPPLPVEAPSRVEDSPAYVQIVPAEVVLHPGQSAVLTAKLFDANGRFLRAAKAAWSAKGIHSTVSETGKLVIAPGSGFEVGTVEGRVDTLAGQARVRVVPTIPFKLDFEKLEDGSPPTGWVGAERTFAVTSIGDERALKKIPSGVASAHGEGFFGLPSWKNYTLQADVLGTEVRASLPSLTLVNSGYQLVLLGNEERLRLVSWLPQPRVEQARSFPWKPNVWYSMKLRCETTGEKSLARAKVWPRDEAEPTDWTIELEDPVPSPGGSPGIQAFSAGVTARSSGSDGYFDNIQVTSNE